MLGKALLFTVASSFVAVASAATLFSHGFENRLIEPVIPTVNGVFQLPPGPAVNQLDWILQQLAQPDTSIAEINERFSPAWLAQISPTATRDFIQSVRAGYPNAVVTDVVTITPTTITAVIDTPGSGFPAGFLTLGAGYTGQQQIRSFGVGAYFGSVQFFEDRELSMSAAADKFESLSTDASLLVGRIGTDGQCTAMVDRAASQPRATGSIFKIWVMAGVAEGIKAGDITGDQAIPLVAAERALGGSINVNPYGTLFSVSDLAQLMLGISDNTATDLLHELAGRARMEQAVVDSGVASPGLLTPFLSINEQFHLFFSVPFNDAQDYVSGSEVFQRNFLENTIVPLGPLTTTPFFHESLLIGGSWQASPLDICAGFSSLRDLPNGSEAFQVADLALSSSTAQPDVRGNWDRVWYKGGSLESGVNGLLVLTHAWMLEREGEDPYVVVAMSNAPAGQIDTFDVQSITGRILQLVAED